MLSESASDNRGLGVMQGLATHLAFSYRRLGLLRDGNRHLAIATVIAIARGQQEDVKKVLERDEVSDVVSAVQARLKDSYGSVDREASELPFPYHYIVDEEGTPITDEPILMECLKAIRELEEDADLNKSCPSVLPSQEQKKWEGIIIDEMAHFLRVLGVSVERLPVSSKVVYLGHDDFQEQARKRLGGFVHDGFCSYDRVFLDQTQNLPTFIHTLVHEFMHFSGGRIFQVNVSGGEKDFLLVAKKGMYQSEWEIEGESYRNFFEVFDESITEFFGYLFRILLLIKYREELEEDLGEEGLMDLIESYTETHVFFKGMIGFIQYVAKVAKMSPIDVIRKFAKTYFTADMEAYNLLQSVFPPDSYEVLRKTKHKEEDIGKYLGLVLPFVGDGEFEDSNPLTDPLMRQLVEFFGNKVVEEEFFFL